MEEYPEELRTPPVTLTSVVGCPELHSQISTQLHSERPPINTLALPDLSKIFLFSKKKESESDPTSPSSSIGGIFKKDWLLKHRTKIPAVLAALFHSEHVFGDPVQWLQKCSSCKEHQIGYCSRPLEFLWLVFTDSLKIPTKGIGDTPLWSRLLVLPLDALGLLLNQCPLNTRGEKSSFVLNLFRRAGGKASSVSLPH